MTKKRKPEFVYQPRSRESYERLRFDDDVRHAYRGDTGRLCDYLRKPHLELTDEHREKLADLIDWCIQRKKRGRPPGSCPIPNPCREAESVIISEVRQLKLNRFRGKRLPKGMLSELMTEVLNKYAERFEGLDFSIENIRRELKRGTKQKAKPSSASPPG
jgi:hypothetical protein